MWEIEIERERERERETENAVNPLMLQKKRKERNYAPYNRILFLGNEEF